MGAEQASPGAARRHVPGVSLVLGLLAALLPKCPVCIAAYLSLLGVTVGVAGVIGTLLRPAAFTLVVLSLGVLLVRHRRRGRGGEAG
ncbi:hypothetical protein ACN47A_03900 [Myxococcus fulvus]|uniref:hypothetical protein n=1 Tax=Myxococcus fulvus TaxID=33 RepID=UPI003B9B5290